jgi:transmembrane sensor
MSVVDQRVRTSIAQEAAEWFVRNRSKAISEEERAAFGVWLKSSPLHIEEYLKTAVMSRDLHTATHSLDSDIESLIRDAHTDDAAHTVSPWGGYAPWNLRTRPEWRIGLPRMAAIAAAILLIVVGAFWIERDGQRFGLPKDFVTVHGEQGSWLLPDGTSMSLNSDSAVTVRYSSRERLVEVERGQALFQVAHERLRRFRVIAGETGVIAVGTEFDVLRKSDATLITVAEGKVAVFTGEAPTIATNATLPLQALSIGAGEQILINDHSRLAKPNVVNVQQALAWVQRQVAFTEQPLGDVATEFNRYGAVPIVIESDRLRELPISGVFNAYDTDSFVAFISRLDGVEIDRTAERILVHASVN